jgi:lysophospholipase L1-like esterase
MKILFQGDSITDAGRDHRNYHDMGRGYPKYASELIKENHPDCDFEFINFGISGNRTSQLFDRLYKDCIEFQPDVVSVLIGINDIWHRHDFGSKILTTDKQIETNYRAILERLKNETNAKIVMIAPYVLDHPSKEYLREDLKTVRTIVRALADEFADVFIPLDDLFSEAVKSQPEPLYYSADGVHPNENGSRFIGECYAKAVEPLLAK